MKTKAGDGSRGVGAAGRSLHRLRPAGSKPDAAGRRPPHHRRVPPPPAPGRRPPAPLLLLAFCLFAFASAACGAGARGGLTGEQQAAIDRVTEDVAAGRDDKLYEEAAPEWRERVTAEDNRLLLARVRERLGPVRSRALHAGTQKDTGGRPTLVVTYQTTFERATGMETFQLAERDGRWLLVGYSVTSDALK